LKDYIWVFPLIAGILTIIGLFTPSIYVLNPGMNIYYWMWGLMIVDSGPYGSFTYWYFELSPPKESLSLFLQQFIHFIGLFVFATWICILAYKAAKERNPNKYELFWIILGISHILASISYIIGIGGLESSFWKTANPGFGIIAPFISGGLSIFGAILSIYLRKKEVQIIIEKE
jgi:hypothetical protein